MSSYSRRIARKVVAGTDVHILLHLAKRESIIDSRTVAADSESVGNNDRASAQSHHLSFLWHQSSRVKHLDHVKPTTTSRGRKNEKKQLLVELRY